MVKIAVQNSKSADKKRLWMIILILLFLSLLAPIIFSYGIYWYGLNIVSNNPVAPKMYLSSLIEHTIWAALRESGNIRIKSLSPIDMLKFYICVFSVTDSKEIDNCHSKYPGMNIALCASKIHISEQKRFSNLKYGIAIISYAIWISQKWNSREILSYIGTTSYIRQNIRGIRESVKIIFKKDEKNVNANEAAILISVLLNPLDSCNIKRVNERKNRILVYMRNNGVITKDQLSEFLSENCIVLKVKNKICS